MGNAAGALGDGAGSVTEEGFGHVQARRRFESDVRRVLRVLCEEDLKWCSKRVENVVRGGLRVMFEEN